MATLSRLKELYSTKVKKELAEEFGIKNVMAVPTITKIVVNSGLGEAKDDAKVIDEMERDIAVITGQKPVRTIAKEAVSNFKLKEGVEIGLKVTLRKDMMWFFLDRLIGIVLPRIKDFRGVSDRAFDGHGNYALGIREHTVFPEVDATRVSKLRGLQIIICTNATSDEQARALLTKLGMPFRKAVKKQ